MKTRLGNQSMQKGTAANRSWPVQPSDGAPERVAAREKRTAIGGSPPGRVLTLGERDSRLKYCASLRRDTAETQDNAESLASCGEKGHGEGETGLFPPLQADGSKSGAAGLFYKLKRGLTSYRRETAFYLSFRMLMLAHHSFTHLHAPPSEIRSFIGTNPMGSFVRWWSLWAVRWAVPCRLLAG